MAKKRVHELAKELKVHGIEMDNKELVSTLHSLGYDVKSHSSSLEDDQATSAVEKIVAKLKPKAPPAPVKAGDSWSVGRSTRPRHPWLLRPPSLSSSPRSRKRTRRARRPKRLRLRPPSPRPSRPSLRSEVPAVAASATPAVTPPPAASCPTRRQRRRTPPGGPRWRAPVEMKPSVVRPPSEMGQVQARGPMGGMQVMTNDPNRRPTATQAVVITRPLIPIKRVTPSSSAHKNIPLAPGPKAIGEVKEFKVVSDALGRGRDFIDVPRTRPGGGRKRTKATVEESLSKQEIMDMARGGPRSPSAARRSGRPRRATRPRSSPE